MSGEDFDARSHTGGSSAAGSTTRQWIPLWKLSDREALGELCRRFERRVWGLAQAKIQSSGLNDRAVAAEDVVQEAWMTMAERDPGRFESVNDSDSLFTVLATIIVDRCIDARRRSQAQKRGGGEVRCESQLESDGSRSPLDVDQNQQIGRFSSQDSPDLEIIGRELLDKAYASISDSRQSVVLGMMLDGATNDEIAECIPCSRSTVKRLKHDLTVLLRSQLDLQPLM